MTRHFFDGADRTDTTRRTEELSGVDSAMLLDVLCGNAVRLLANTQHPARRLRMRVGEVSVDLEFAGGLPVADGEPVTAQEPAAAQEPSRYITAQTVGVFYRAPEPGASPFVREGDTVVKGQQVGIIEAMKLMIPVEADGAGTVTEALKSDGEPVEYGERLFALRAEDS